MRNAEQAAEATVAGRAIWQAGGHRPSTFPGGRVCDASGCSTVLSIYNRRDSCSEHEVARPRPPRFERPLTADLQVNRRLLTLADFLSKGA